MANDGDRIFVAGDYVEALTITDEIDLYGGYNASFTSRSGKSQVTHPGGSATNVLRVQSNAIVTVNAFDPGDDTVTQVHVDWAMTRPSTMTVMPVQETTDLN